MLTDQEVNLLRSFECEFPSEHACIAYVRELLAEDGRLVCHHCGSANVESLEQRTVRCIECGEDSWFTAGTFFARAKKLKPLFALLWFQEHDLPLSSSRARDLLGIAQSSAWVMLKKIELALSSGLSLDPKKTVVLLCDAFSNAIRKRSRQTPAGEHPSVETHSQSRAGNDECLEADVDSEGRTQPTRSATANLHSTLSMSASLSEPQQRIFDVMTQARNNSIHIETLSNLTGIRPDELCLQLMCMEMDKLIKAEGFGRYKIDRSQIAYLVHRNSAEQSVPTESLQEKVEQFISFCHQRYHGISGKYLQLYLALSGRVFCNVVKDFQNRLRLLLTRAPVDYREIVRYVSPAQVWMALGE
jgi:hypothetical protein